MAERTHWVFRNACGCPSGVLEGRRADARPKAWRLFFGTVCERNAAVDRGVTADLVSHDEYMTDVSEKLSSRYTCSHGDTR